MIVKREKRTIVRVTLFGGIYGSLLADVTYGLLFDIPKESWDCVANKLGNSHTDMVGINQANLHAFLSKFCLGVHNATTCHTSDCNCYVMFLVSSLVHLHEDVMFLHKISCEKTT